MKLTFPNMGNMYVPVKVLLDELGIEHVLPVPTNKHTLKLGVENAPESICLPFKTMLGEFLDAIERGADCVLFGGGCGQCRLGYYGEPYKELFNWKGMDKNFIFLNTAHMSVKDIWKKFSPYIKGNRYLKAVKAIFLTVLTVFYADYMIKLTYRIRCREVKPGDTDKILTSFRSSLNRVNGFWGVWRLLGKTVKRLKQIEIRADANPLKVLFTGEIYMNMESAANMSIAEKLGRLGVEVENNLSIGYWIKHHFFEAFLPFNRMDEEHEAALEFFKTNDIGGHGLLTVGSLVTASKRGLEGAVHVYPLGCMPEIAAQSAFSHITEKYGIPILSLVVDEMTGEAGLNTRLEAFVDMLESRRENKIGLPGLTES